MRVLNGLTASQKNTLVPILNSLKSMIKNIQNQGIIFILDDLKKDMVKDHAWLQNHAAIKLVLNKNGKRFVILNIRITNRGKLLSGDNNEKTVFNDTEELLNFINQ